MKLQLMIENLDSLNIYKASVILLSGCPAKPVDALFFHGRSFGDYTGLFELTAELASSDRVGAVVLFGNEGQRMGSSVPFEANPGKTWCREQLIGYGVSDDKILFAQEGGYHTKWENQDFVRLAGKRGWLSGVILTQPHQILRATLGMIRAMQEQQYGMEIYTAIPSQVPWGEVVKGSQGREEKPRIEHIKDELARVARYQQNGDIASFEDLFAYLESRDKGKLVLGPTERGSQLFARDLK